LVKGLAVAAFAAVAARLYYKFKAALTVPVKMQVHPVALTVAVKVQVHLAASTVAVKVQVQIFAPVRYADQWKIATAAVVEPVQQRVGVVLFRGNKAGPGWKQTELLRITYYWVSGPIPAVRGTTYTEANCTINATSLSASAEYYIAFVNEQPQAAGVYALYAEGELLFSLLKMWWGVVQIVRPCSVHSHRRMRLA